MTDEVGPEPDEDEMHRKFREALERKKPAKTGGKPGTTGGQGVGPSQSGKSMRRFQRKSGG